MRVSVNLKFETPEGMSITDFVDAVEKGIIDFLLKTKCNLESSKVKELAPKESKNDQD